MLQEKFSSIHQRLTCSQPQPMAQKDVSEVMASLNVQEDS